MALPQRKKSATYEDLKVLPEGVLGQILDGELIASPRPANSHVYVSSVLGMYLGGPFQLGGGGPGGWWLLDEPELHLGQDVLVPDMGGWRRERLPAIPSDPYFTLTPNWILEVLSPSTAGIDRVRKMPKYAKSGVEHAWIVDPLERSLEVFRLSGGHWVLMEAFEGDAKIRAEPFEAVELELGALWNATSPPT